MIVPATADDFAAVIAGNAPTPYRLVADSVIAPPSVMTMLADLASTICANFTPSAWLIIEQDEIVGLISLVVPVTGRTIKIGYGVAPTREKRGATSRALRDLLEWARLDPRIDTVTAETSQTNLASQRVLEKNGFARSGTRHDDEDGDLIIWAVAV
jgi:RimJ/RimL family protein N-acetyltransferase